MYHVNMIVIDVREKHLLEYYTGQEDISSCALPVGDIHILKDDQIIAIVERKTIADLQSSIVDGRYREQKSRLLACKCKVFYVIEGTIGTIGKRKGSLPENTLWSAIIHTMIRDNCFVFRTSDVQETGKFLDRLNHCYAKLESGSCSTQAPISVVSKRDKRSEPKTVFYCQLRAIPGVSDAIAKTIMNQYDNLSILIDAVRTNEQFEKETKNTVILNGKRKVGPAVTKRLIESFGNAFASTL